MSKLTPEIVNFDFILLSSPNVTDSWPCSLLPVHVPTRECPCLQPSIITRARPQRRRTLFMPHPTWMLPAAHPKRQWLRLIPLLHCGSQICLPLREPQFRGKSL